MLLNVVPRPVDAHISAVLFTVIFHDLDPKVPTSPAWTSQLQDLYHDELDIPEMFHALDKAVGIICLLDEVTFDLANNVISCQFLDGSVEQWPLPVAGCLEVLERIVRDVNESSLDIEREFREHEFRERERERERRRFESAPLPSKAPRHKKQRSLLMTLVASIIPIYSASSQTRLPSPPPTPISERKSPTDVSPRDRRRRARSDLVDVFRRYALTELARRVPRGGYYSWILHSMLRMSTQNMERLIADGAAVGSSIIGYYPEPEFFSITTASLPPTPSVSDDDGETPATDTDDSSIRTPTSSRFNSIEHNPYPSDTYANAGGLSPENLTESSRRFLSERDHALYTENVAFSRRLRLLVARENARQGQNAEDLQHHYNVLEIRSRRRAWINKSLVGGIRNTNTDLGMSMPFRSSPIALRSWSSEDYEYAPEPIILPPSKWDRPQSEYDEYDKLELRIMRTRKSVVNRLFPVSEEETDDLEEDNAQDVREILLQFDDFEVDLEEGVRYDGTDEIDDDDSSIQVALDIERPQIRPRVRTSSMYQQRFHVPPPAGLPVPLSLPTQQYLHSSPLPRSEPIPAPVRTRNEVMDISISQPLPVHTSVDVNLNVGQVYNGYGKYSEDEFTLAMDLPMSVRTHDRGLLVNKRRLSVGSEHSWPLASLLEEGALRPNW